MTQTSKFFPAGSKVRFITLGCKVNQYETQGMREILTRAGVESARRPDAGGRVDYVVINTCTVTREADRESRYWIRRARREHPGARVIVTGCGVERDRKAIEALKEVDLVLANHEKADIAERLHTGCGTPEVQEARYRRQRFAPLSISASEGRTRAFVKIQDGCNHACSFCKVVLARGRSRSRPLNDILEEIRKLRDAGYREIVFAGIQLGAYGLDEGSGGARNLVDVLYEAGKIEGIERLRLSSIEPTDVRPSLIDALRDLPKCCPQLHIPLQSGDSDILRRMNRRYEREFYIDLVARLKDRVPDFCLTLDVMAGFPGEEERHFQKTLRLLEEVEPLKCHVFPYSRREGTRASKFEDLPATLLRERVARLIAAGDRLGLRVRRRYRGRVLPVLVEKYHARKTGRYQGLTANYLKVLFDGDPGQTGKILPLELLDVEGDALLGRTPEAWFQAASSTRNSTFTENP